MTEHAILASGNVDVELWDIDDGGDAGDIRVTDMDIDDSTAHCECGAQFKDLNEAREHMIAVGMWS